MIEARSRPTGGSNEIAAVVLLSALYYLAYFSPALLDGRLLAPGDGLIYYVPALLSRAAIWNHALYAGHPGFADAQALFFNPLRLLGNYNAALVAIYVLASTSAYCLVRYLTGMRSAGALAAIVYGSGASMVAHLGHLTIIYSAAWMPLMAWAVARCRDGDFPAAVAIGAIAIACPMLGGHPQIFVYAVALTGLYALYSLLDPALHRRGPLALRYAVMFGAGLAIAGMQLIPLAELGSWSVRERMTFADFVSYSLDPRSLLLFFFPRILGSYGEFGLPYFGTWNITELATYAGISTLLLALIAATARRRERDVMFWVVAAVASVLYAMGKFTPLGELAFHLPGLNQFRAPARTAFVTTLALAVLAGFGMRAIAQRRLCGARLKRAQCRSALLLGAPIVALLTAYPWIESLAAAQRITLPGILHNPAFLSALLVMVVSVLVVSWSISRPSLHATVVLLAVLTLDLGSFGWFQEWRGAPDAGSIALNETWTRFSRDLRDAHDRVLFIDGMNSGDAPGRPNLNLLYELPSASGYGPLILRDYSQVMGMGSTGSIASTDQLQRRLKLAGVGWLIGGNDPDRGLRFGGDCSSIPGSTESTLRLPLTSHVTQVEVVSQMFCSIGVKQDATVMKMDFASAAGPNAAFSLRAGIDTAEWAIDRPDVASTIQHARPDNSETYPAGSFNGRWFRTRVKLRSDGSAVDVDRVRLEWMQPAAPGIAIRSIDLIDSAGRHHRFSGEDLLRSELSQGAETSLPGAQWVSHVESIARPAWLVDEAVPLDDGAALATIRSGHLPDGRAFDPYRTALIENDPASSSNGPRQMSTGRVIVEHQSNGMLSVDTNTAGPAFLVIAESFYPGWEARIDGAPTSILRANVAFQGVRIPAGTHRVLFSFAPKSLWLGVAAALAGLVILLAYFYFVFRSRPREMPKTGSGLVKRFHAPAAR